MIWLAWVGSYIFHDRYICVIDFKLNLIDFKLDSKSLLWDRLAQLPIKWYKVATCSICQVQFKNAVARDLDLFCLLNVSHLSLSQYSSLVRPWSLSEESFSTNCNCDLEKACSPPIFFVQPYLYLVFHSSFMSLHYQFFCVPTYEGTAEWINVINQKMSVVACSSLEQYSGTTKQRKRFMEN